MYSFTWKKHALRNNNNKKNARASNQNMMLENKNVKTHCMQNCYKGYYNTRFLNEKVCFDPNSQLEVLQGSDSELLLMERMVKMCKS